MYDDTEFWTAKQKFKSMMLTKLASQRLISLKALKETRCVYFSGHAN